MIQEIQIILTLEADTSRNKDDIRKFFSDMEQTYTRSVPASDRMDLPKLILVDVKEEREIYKTDEAVFKTEVTTDELLIEIVSYQYKSAGFPYVFLDYSLTFRQWEVTWRNPVKFSNERQTMGQTPREACKKALEFIKANPDIFYKVKMP